MNFLNILARATARPDFPPVPVRGTAWRPAAAPAIDQRPYLPQSGNKKAAPVLGAPSPEINKHAAVSLLSVLRSVAWLGFASLFVFLATLPAAHATQTVVSVIILAVLYLSYEISRRVKSPMVADILRLIVVFTSAFLSLRYIYWRTTESLPLHYGMVSMVCGLLLVLAEIYGFINTMLGYLINVRPLNRVRIPLPDDADLLPHVDVYIPTYNEEPAIIRSTVIAATQMHYSREKLHVYILDDGGTDQKIHDKDPVKARAARERAAAVKEIAVTFGAHYLTREKNEHAKAGNINSALKSTHGEFLLVLDCDHIPTEDFVNNTVGFFLVDPKLFLVQTPHNFINADPVERNLHTEKRSPAENELFYDVMQPGLDFWGTSFFCGSAAMLRRSVIDELGGISGQTITEDAETTLDALGKGYTTMYYPKPMVSGLQPETYSAFIVQRVRWGQGMLQIFLLKNPLTLPGLTTIQRVLYLNFAFFWGFSLSRFILLLAPPAYLIFSINLCDATPSALISYAAPSLIGALISTQYFYGRVRWPFISQLYEIIQSVYVTFAIFQVIKKPRSPSFNVTPKGEVLDKDFLSAMATPFYVFLMLTVTSLGFGIYRYFTDPWSQGAVMFVGFWAVLDCILLLCALGITFERKQVRSEPRSGHREKVSIVDPKGVRLTGITENASACGIRILVDQAMPDMKPGRELILDFPDRSAHILVTLKSVQPESSELGFEYNFRRPEDERLAVQIAYGSSANLRRNNETRHGGRSTVTALFDLVKYAVQFGLPHLRELLVRFSSRIALSVGH